MSEQQPDPVRDDSTTEVVPPKPPVHPLRGWLIALVIEMAVLVVALVALGGVVWLSTSPSRANWGPGQAVTITVNIHAGTGTVQVAVGGQISTVAIDAVDKPMQRWQEVVPFGESAKVVMTFSGAMVDSGSWDPTSSIRCDISNGATSLSSASVDVVGNSAVCEWTNR